MISRTLREAGRSNVPSPCPRRPHRSDAEEVTGHVCTTHRGCDHGGTSDQPYRYQRVELVEPDWTRFPGWKDVTAEDWASVQWQRAHCIKNIKQLRALMGDLIEDRFYDDLERDQAERATMSMLVPPQMINTMVPHAGARHRVVLRRPGTPLHAAGLLRPPYRLAEPPARHPRQPARARHVGRRGPHPPLPHQGAGRDAADLPAVLRPLHPDGPGRQLHAGHRQAQVQPQAGRPDRRDARLPARQPRRPRRRRLRWRRGQHALAPGWRRSSTRCSTSTTSATSGWPPRR